MNGWAKRRFFRVGHGGLPFGHQFWLGVWRFDLNLTIWRRS